MDSLLQSFRPTLPLANSAPFALDMEYGVTSDNVDTYQIDLSWPNYNRSVSSESTDSQNDVRSEEGRGITNKNTFHFASMDEIGINDDCDDDNWNIRSDDEEKDFVYYVPPGAYRSYVLESNKGDAESKAEEKNVDNDEQPSTNLFEIASSETFDNREEDDDNYNIRSDDEDKYFMYQIPSSAYRSYDLGSSGKEREEEDGKTGCRNDNNGKIAENRDLIEPCGGESERDGKSSTIDTEDDFEEYLDLTTPQSMANSPRVPTEKVSRQDLCHVCRTFHDAKNPRSGNRGARLVQKLMSWRKKSRKETCARCGYGIDRRSFLKRLFGKDKKAAGTY